MQQQNDIIKDITEIRLVNLDEKLQEEERSRLALEVWGCKWNLVIRGIEGSTNESPVVTEEKVRAFLSRDLNLNKRSMIFAAVHRTSDKLKYNRSNWGQQGYSFSEYPC